MTQQRLRDDCPALGVAENAPVLLHPRIEQSSQHDVKVRVHEGRIADREPPFRRQIVMGGLHRLPGLVAARVPAQHGPGLWIQEDLALGALVGPELSPVGPVGAQVPPSIPGVLFEARVQPGQLPSSPLLLIGLRQ